jgi:hypothetical protein
MKSQSIVKSGAAIGGAVALLLISALLAPSTALAGTGKLYPTGVEPGASGQLQVSGTGPSGAVAVSCKGLTPEQWYHFEAVTYVSINYQPWKVWLGSGGGVASKNGSFKGGCSFQYPYYPIYSIGVQVYNAGGQVVLGGECR